MENEYAIWTEKYRPHSFDDIKGQKEIVEKVRAFVEKKNMPHLLFAGPAGVGKTTTSLVIAKELYGDEWRNNVLELNASDERGIDVVRVKVKDFARTKAIGNVPFKIIYLDECDALTKDAQHALRRTMENYTNTCRFILSCNYSSKIIDPIQSRCSVFKFKPLGKEELEKVVKEILAKENISADASAIDALVEISGGDCRRLSNILQACSAFNSTLTEELVYSMASVAKPKQVQHILGLAQSGEFLQARSECLKLQLEYGLSGVDLIKQIQKEALHLEGLDNKDRMRIIEKCGEIEFRMSEGSDEFVQLEALLAYIGLISAKSAQQVKQI